MQMPVRLLPNENNSAIGKAYTVAGIIILIIAAALEIAAITVGHISVFSVLPLIIFIGMIAYLLLSDEVRNKIKSVKAFALIIKIYTNVLTFAVVLALALGMLMFMYTSSASVESPNTVIVMGCQVIDGNPSVMLSRRIDAAYGVLSSNPKSVCIATGGMGEGTDIAESEVIKRELIMRGIDEKRIFIETSSTDTASNIAQAAKIIKNNKLDTNVVIATDGFHQMRSQKTAAKHGLTASAVNAKTPWYLIEPMIMREMCALTKCSLLGY